MKFLNRVKQVKAETLTIKDNKYALECVEYILDHESTDYFEQCADQNITFKNWDQCKGSIYVAALKAVGLTPDEDGFGDY